MTLTIWKTVLKPLDYQTVELPQGAEILHAREQGDDLCIWYRCDPKQPLEERQIAICGTGHEAPNSAWRYIGTGHLYRGNLVFHVFTTIR